MLCTRRERENSRKLEKMGFRAAFFKDVTSKPVHREFTPRPYVFAGRRRRAEQVLSRQAKEKNASARPTIFYFRQKASATSSVTILLKCHRIGARSRRRYKDEFCIHKFRRENILNIYIISTTTSSH